MIDFREGGLFTPPIREHPQICPSWIGLRSQPCSCILFWHPCYFDLHVFIIALFNCAKILILLSGFNLSFTKSWYNLCIVSTNEIVIYSIRKYWTHQKVIKRAPIFRLAIKKPTFAKYTVIISPTYFATVCKHSQAHDEILN